MADDVSDGAKKKKKKSNPAEKRKAEKEKLREMRRKHVKVTGKYERFVTSIIYISCIFNCVIIITEVV